jgi:hypothetical protein
MAQRVQHFEAGTMRKNSALASQGLHIIEHKWIAESAA